MRRRRALVLALATGLIILGLALGLAILQPTGMPIPHYP